MKTSTYILSTMMLSMLGGCATMQKELHDPSYAPTYPESPAPPKASDGSIYQPGFGMNLFADAKAFRVGDLLTITLSEKTQASKSASTQTGKDQSIDLAAPTIFGAPVIYNGNNIFENSVDFEREFSGDGSSNQSNSLSGSITVTVSEVLPNGNLVVGGEKLVTLNQGDEYLRISGMVRPIDISPNNEVASTKVANARIIYGGRGVIDEANQKGWMARFFNSPYMPF